MGQGPGSRGARSLRLPGRSGARTPWRPLPLRRRRLGVPRGRLEPRGDGDHRVPHARGRAPLARLRRVRAADRAAPGRGGDRRGDHARDGRLSAAARARERAPAYAPQLLLVAGALSQYAGAGVAVLLFHAVAPSGLAWLRSAFAALLLCAW